MPLYEGLSYGSQKTAVIIDLGRAYTKCGFSGENGPRAIIPTEIRRKTGLVKLRDVLESEEAYAVMVDFVHFLFFRHLLVNPKERRVVVVESMLTPTNFRNLLAKVLFNHYEVPSLLFAPSHLVTLLALGLPSGLVLDVGYHESLALPVYESIPLLKAWQAIPIGGALIHKCLEKELLQTAKISIGRQEDCMLNSVMDSIDENTLEDIKVRCCFVTKFERGKQIFAANTSEGDNAEKYPTPPPDVDYPLDGGRILKIPGKVREHTAEVLFEQDNEETSIATLLLDSIVQCPMDVRKTMAENIVLTGGTAMLTGFKHRLVAELRDLLLRPKYQEQLSVTNFKFHVLPAKENYAAWLGGAIMGDLEVLASRSVSREAYQLSGKMPDWSNIPDIEPEEKSQVHTRK